MLTYCFFWLLQLSKPYFVKKCCYSSQALAAVSAGGIVDVPLAQTGEGIAECELLKWFVQEVCDMINCWSIYGEACWNYEWMLSLFISLLSSQLLIIFFPPHFDY